MKIEDQNVSIELAEEMKELGAEQDSVWYWCRVQNDIRDYIAILRERDIQEMDEWYQVTKICSAPTVAEMGKKLPIGYRSYYYDGHPSGGTWMCNDDKIIGVADAKTEADARAKMWIFLKKKGCYKK